MVAEAREVIGQYQRKSSTPMPLSPSPPPLSPPGSTSATAEANALSPRVWYHTVPGPVNSKTRPSRSAASTSSRRGGGRRSPPNRPRRPRSRCRRGRTRRHRVRPSPGRRTPRRGRRRSPQGQGRDAGTREASTSARRTPFRCRWRGRKRARRRRRRRASSSRWWCITSPGVGGANVTRPDSPFAVNSLVKNDSPPSIDFAGSGGRRCWSSCPTRRSASGWSSPRFCQHRLTAFQFYDHVRVRRLVRQFEIHGITGCLTHPRLP